VVASPLTNTTATIPTIKRVPRLSQVREPVVADYLAVWLLNKTIPKMRPNVATPKTARLAAIG
jgi:hypothetical protein